MAQRLRRFTSGFIFTAIGCALYNWVAGMVGGIEVQLDPPARVA